MLQAKITAHYGPTRAHQIIFREKEKVLLSYFKKFRNDALNLAVQLRKH